MTTQQPHIDTAARSFIIAHGKVGWSVRQLVHDMRSVMSPYTAKDLENRNNTLKDFLAVSGLLNVTHLVAFTATDLGTYMRTSRMPRGPTLTFRVHKYSLVQDIHKLRKQGVHNDGLAPALVVMSGFGSEEKHVKLMATMFQNMFPTLSVANTNPSKCKRVVLLKYDKDTQRVELRHYAITLNFANVSKTVKRVIANRLGDHLKKYMDVADFVLYGGDALSSGSEAEDPTGESHVEVETTSTASSGSKMSVRLLELGPRMQLELVKVEADFFKGEVIYHSYVHKTPEEIREHRAHIEKLKALKTARRLEQERNVELKKQARNAKKGGNRDADDDIEAIQDDLDNLPRLDAPEAGAAGGNEDEDEDEDATWYQKEVGEAPAEGMFAKNSEKNKKTTPAVDAPQITFKKRKQGGKQQQQQQQQQQGKQKRGFAQFRGGANKKRKAM